MPQWVSLCLGAALALIGGIISSFLTSFWTQKRTYAEKWWALKCEAYSKIIETLYHAADCSHRLGNGEIGDDRLSTEELIEKRNILQDRLAKAHEQIGIATGIGAYIISDQVAKVLLDLRVASNKRILQGDPPAIHLWNEAEGYDIALQKVRVLAKDDLKVR
jgi:hypothetical protein